MTTIVDLDTGQVLGLSMGGTTKASETGSSPVRWLAWRLGVQVVAIDPSAAFRKALRMWLPRIAVAVDHFHLVSLGNQAMTETRQNLSPQVKGRHGRTVDKASAHRMLLLRAGETGSTDHPPKSFGKVTQFSTVPEVIHHSLKPPMASFRRLSYASAHLR